tara:strand:+ start:278 stop:529 length:252 start_codon:yes stop_codon:yes gene_type:complete
MHTAIRIAIVASAALMPLSPALAMSQPPQSQPGHGSGPSTGGSSGGSAGSPHSVPEPGMFALFATGLVGAYAGRRLSKRRKKD